MSKKIIIAIAILAVGAGALFFILRNNSPVSSGPSPTLSTGKITLAVVAQHNNSSSCWSAINGKVYDLTSWINQHPGGPDQILSICGIDGSSAFNGQHGGQPRPANELTNFFIGNLTK